MPVYTARGITKTYGGVVALRDVDLDIEAGEVHALLGANGAGKSTLVKVLVGGTDPTNGELALRGTPVAPANPAAAARDGVAIVSQELNLYPELDVLANLFLLREPRRLGVSDRGAMRRAAAPVLEAVGLDIDVDAPVAGLRLAEQQLVEIARALLTEPEILFLDEPTSALQAAETERLLGVVRRLRDDGVAVVYVSHFLEDVFAVADRITVLRNGEVVVARRRREEMTIAGAVAEMLGEAAEREPPAPRAAAASPGGPLRLSGLTLGRRLQPLDLVAEPGEVVGLAGLEGAGVDAVFELVFGRAKPTAGSIELPSGASGPRSVSAAVKAGVAYVPADRKGAGLLLEESIAANVTSVSGGPLGRLGRFVRPAAVDARAEHWAEALGIKTSSVRLPAGALSGGNQQKVVLAKWLETDPGVVLLDDPSRGVDIGAKEDMHAIIRDIAAQGRVVLYTSSDLEEMAGLCDRVHVFFGGRHVGELPRHQLSEHTLLEAINVGAVPEGAVPVEPR